MFNLRITGDLGFEFWKDIPEYKGLYRASTYGNIFGIKRQKNLAQIKNIDGYLGIRLCKGGKTQYFGIHRLIALTFLPKCNINLVEANHKDENKDNNRVENLEWCTHKYNMNYGTALKRTVSKTTNGKCSKKVIRISSTGEKKEYPSLSEIHRLYGYSIATIHRRCKDNLPYNGFIWKYA